MRKASLLVVVLALASCGGGSGGKSATGGGGSTTAASAFGPASSATTSGAVDIDSVDDLCTVYTVQEASAITGVTLRMENNFKGQFHHICYYVASGDAASGSMSPDVELHLFKTADAPTTFNQLHTNGGGTDHEVPGLGRKAYGTAVGISVLIDDTHYLTVSTGVSSNDEHKDIQIATVVLQRLSHG